MPPTRRVEREEVCEVIDTDLGNEAIEALRDVASEIVDEIAAAHPGKPASRLRRGELYLTAHLITIREGAGELRSVKVGPTTESFESQPGELSRFATIAIQALPELAEELDPDTKPPLEWSVKGVDDAVGV